MRRIKYIMLTAALVMGFGLAIMPASVASADVYDDACSGAEAAKTAVCQDRDKNKALVFIHNLVNVLLYVLGAVSVIVMIIAGFFYATSGGDSALITKAKNTLLYAVVGLIVAICAYAIVGFVIGSFTSTTTPPSAPTTP